MASLYGDVKKRLFPNEDPQPVLVDITNAAKWFYEDTPQEVWFTKDFPSLLSPWPVAWYEWETPAYVNSNGKMTPLRQGRKFGVVCLSFKLNEPVPITSAIMEVGLWDAILGPLGGSPPPKNIRLEAESAGEGPAHFVQAYGMMLREQGAIGMLGNVFMPLDVNGRLCGWELESSAWLNPGLCGQVLKPIGPLDPNIKLSAFCLSVYFACSLLSCKNVSISPIAQDRPAKRAKNRHTNGTRWHTLTIGGIRAILEGEGQSATGGIKRALHICRGHFGNYTEGRGLFGKYHGRFWIPAHVRGTASEGRVEKEYKVLAPSEREG